MARLIPGGTSTGEDTVKVFEGILGQAANMDTGFIVLAHDLYEVTVDLAVGYMLDTALAHQPPFKLESIGRCLNIDLNNLYAESATIDITQDGSNSGSNSSTGNGSSNPGSDTGSSGSNSTGAADQGGNGAASLSTSAFAGVVAAAVAAVLAGAL